MSTDAFAACTVLELGARGSYGGAKFQLAGRTCVKSTRGGLWNEWAVVFADGRRAFLAEAMNGLTLFTEGPIAPPFASLAVGAPLDTAFVVAERGEAKRVATWGDAPAGPKTYRYADLSARDGRSATIDYGSGDPAVFVGVRTTLAELGLSPRKGKASFISVKNAPRPKGLETWLDVGDEGTLAAAHGGGTFRVIGIVQRSIRIEGERYTWEEYVLHSPADGIRWLVVSDGHWNLVHTIDAGLVDETAETRATFRGEKHRFYSGGRAKVEWATGELPWELAIGDTSDVADYVSAPHVLSRESSADEITWSYGRYLEPGAVAKAFEKRVLPKPVGRAPNQPSTSKPRPSGDKR